MARYVQSKAKAMSSIPSQIPAPGSCRLSSSLKPGLVSGLPKAPVSTTVSSTLPCSNAAIASTSEYQGDVSSSICNPPQDSCSLKRHPHFVSAHLGTPCTLGALDHHLKCGHKISTDQPERCASNCKILESIFSNARNDDKAFVCMACIVDEVKKVHDAKVSEFQEEIKAIASATQKQLSGDEISRRLEVIEIGWRELDLMEIRDKVKRGQMSRPFYVEPDYVEAVDVVTQECYYGRANLPEPEMLVPSKRSITKDQAESSEGSLNSTTRSPSPASSTSLSVSGSAKSRLPLRRR